MTPKATKETKQKPASVLEPTEEVMTGRSEARRLSEMAGTGGQQFEGDLLTMEQVKDQELTVLDFKFLPSTFKEGGTYACIQVEREGVKYVVNTNATVILKGLANVNKADLPAPVTFTKTMGKNKREYWNMV